MATYQVNFTDYTIGEDAYTLVGDVCKAFSGNILLLGGETALSAGAAMLEIELEKKDIKIMHKKIYGHDCTMESMEQWANYIKENGITAVFGMGGGKAIDTAKGAAYLGNVPVFTFPTIAATCAATTKLSVVYKNDGSFERFFFYEMPPEHSFIHLGVIASAPAQYFRAGMGDTIGKFFECHFSSRGDKLEHNSLLGRQISNLCYEPLLEHGKKALEDCKHNKVTFEFLQAVLANIVSTGLVSLLVKDDYNCAVAHSVYYGLCLCDGFEEKYLHGDVVAYGVLVQLLIDDNKEKALEVKRFMESLHMPSTLLEMEQNIFHEGAREAFDRVLSEIVSGPDMVHIPYTVSEDMVWEAMLAVEKL